MKKLLKAYNISNNMEYYDICEGSFINGQKKQAQEQFKSMPRANQKEMVRQYITSSFSNQKALFFFDLL